jgi:uncharacterized repeat protein (TIGR03847 family)
VSSSFDLPEADRFTAGTVGPPGARVFYLQASQGAQEVTLRLEKAQVAALAEYLAERLADMPPPTEEELPDDLELHQPVVPEWIVGSLGVSVDDDVDRVVVVAEELVAVDEEHPEPDVDTAVARFGLSRAQVAAFVAHAARLVLAGRPPCPFCGRPMDAEGHACVKANGHSR